MDDELEIIVDYTLADDGQYDYAVIEIRVNPTKCIEFAEDYAIEPIEYIARVLNHEVLHHVLQQEHGRVACRALDMLCSHKKQFTIDYWLW